MVLHKVRVENNLVYICISLCKGHGEITGDIWFELDPDEVQSLAEEIFQILPELLEVE